MKMDLCEENQHPINVKEQEETFSDDEYAPDETIEIKRDGYTYRYNFYEYEFNKNIFEICGSLCHEEKEIGKLKAWLIQRNGYRSNFYSDADSISQELQLLSNQLFELTGKVKRNIFTMFNKEKIFKISHGGFLSIYEVFITHKFRGNDLGFKIIKNLLGNVQSRWTFSVIYPEYFIIGDTKLSHEEKEEKHKRICQLYARVGYKQLPALRHCDYWYLVPEKEKNFSKSRVDNLLIFLHPRPEQHPDSLRDSLLGADENVGVKALLNKVISKGLSIDQSETLHYAAASGNVELMEALISVGANVNHCNSVGFSPLHNAAGTGDVESVRILLKAGADPSKKSDEQTTPFDQSILCVNGSNCFDLCFNLKPRMVQKKGNYDVAFMLMPAIIKNHLIEGKLSPRMFNRLHSVASMEADMMNEELNDFVNRQPKSIEDIFTCSILDYIPKEVTVHGIFKSFLSGMQQLVQSITVTMRHGKCPTKSRVLSLLGWPPNYTYYFEHGGKIEYVYQGLIAMAKEQSWELGDGAFEEINEDYFQLPEVEFLDGDYIYLETIFLNYLLNN